MEKIINYLTLLFQPNYQDISEEVILNNSFDYRRHTWCWIFVLAIVSVLYFVTYFNVGTLHDSAHYATAGVSLIRDRKELLYPYSPEAPGGRGPAYQFYQNNTIQFGARTSYPAKFYTMLYGLVVFSFKKIRLEYLQWINLVTYLLGNIILYLIGRRFLLGVKLLFFLTSVMFLPIMQSAVNPGTDGIGYTVSLFLLWMVLNLRVSPFMLGLFLGGMVFFRGEILSLLLVMPLVYMSLKKEVYYHEIIIPMSIGFLITYSLINFFINKMIGASVIANPNEFYIQHFKNSFYLSIHEIPLILNKLKDNIVAIFNRDVLFIYAGTTIFYALQRKSRFERILAWAAILYISLPILIYSLDRFSLAHSRYYIFAVPIIILIFFLGIQNVKDERFFLVSKKAVLLLQTMLVLLVFYAALGFPSSTLNLSSIKSKMKFMDFNGVEQVLQDNFNENDIVIINHSLATGLSKLHNIIYLPPFRQFYYGNNTQIKGIIFFFSDSPPNDFFKPKDWLENNSLPKTIKDNSGLTFKQIYACSSNAIDNLGNIFNSVSCYIYKNSNTL